MRARLNIGTKFALLIASLNLFASLVFAAGEVIPDLASREQKLEFQALVQRQIPFATRNTPDLILKQMEAVKLLRAKFPQYDQWMAEKPSPVTMEIFEQEIVLDTSYLLNEEPMKKLLHKVDNLYVADLKSFSEVKSENLINELQKRAYQSLKNSFQNSGNSVRGLIVGLAQILPQQERGAFLKLGNPKLQIEALQKMGISDEALQKSGFRAATLDLNQETVTMKQVLEIASQRLNQTDEIFTQLTYLKFLSKIDFAGPDHGKPSEILNSMDFDFATSLSDAFLEQTIRRFKDIYAADNIAVDRAIETFQAGVPRGLFTQAQVKKPIQKLIGTVYEVHPYLAVNRGCLGGDCSTTHSPLFPYSPWEHDFYIKNAEGKFVGYISGARLKAGGVESFYLRDIQGAYLAVPLAEAILHSFPKILGHLNVKQFVIAGANFTNQQNNSPTLRQMLAHYNANSTDRTVPLEFTDAEVRNFIGQNPQLTGSYSYDAPGIHPNGNIFVPKPEFEKKYSFRVRPGTLPTPEPRTRLQAFLGGIRLLVKDINADVSEFSEFTRQELVHSANIFMNSGLASLASYYRNIETLVEKHGIRFSKEFRESNEDLFMLGHLRAPDAFYQDYHYLQDMFSGTKDDGNKKNASEGIFTKLSEKYLIQLSRQHFNYSDLMQVVAEKKKILSENKRFRELLQLYAQRMLTQDVLQLAGFAYAGIEEAKEIFQNTPHKDKVEAAFAQFLKVGPTALGLTFTNAGHPLTVVYNYVLNPSQQHAQTIATQLDSTLSSMFGLRLNAIQTEELNSFILSIYAKSYEFYYNSTLEMMTDFIQKQMKLSRQNRPPYQVLFGFEWLVYKHGNLQLAYGYIDELAEKAEPMDILELTFLSKWGYTYASEKLKKPGMREKTIALIEMLINPQQSEEISKFTVIRASTRQAYNLNWTIAANFTGGNVAAVLQNLSASAEFYGLTKEELFRSPKIRALLSTWMADADGALTHPTSAIWQLGLESFYKKLTTTDSLLSQNYWKRWIDSSDYLSQKPAYKKVLENLQREALTGKCMNCAYALFVLTVRKKIPDQISQHKVILEQLIATNSYDAMIFATARAFERKIPLRLSEAQIATISSIDIATRSPEPWFESLQKDFIEVMRQLKGNRQAIQSKMLTVAGNSSNNNMALRAALAYMANGGTRENIMKKLTGAYDREELKDPELNNEDAQMYQRYRMRMSRHMKTCGSLFHR